MHVHLLFVSKYRRSVFDGDAIERLSNHLKRVANDFEATVKKITFTCWWNTLQKSPSVLWYAA